MRCNICPGFNSHYTRRQRQSNMKTKTRLHMPRQRSQHTTIMNYVSLSWFNNIPPWIHTELMPYSLYVFLPLGFKPDLECILGVTSAYAFFLWAELVKCERFLPEQMPCTCIKATTPFQAQGSPPIAIQEWRMVLLLSSNQTKHSSWFSWILRSSNLLGSNRNFQEVSLRVEERMRNMQRLV